MSFFISFLKEQHIKYHKSKGKNFGRAQGGGGGQRAIQKAKFLERSVLNVLQYGFSQYNINCSIG